MTTIQQINPETMALIDIQRVTDEYEIYGAFCIKKHERIDSGRWDIIKNEYPTQSTIMAPFAEYSTDIHVHTFTELNIIISGKPLFYVYVNDFLYIIECEALDIIGINTGIPHWMVIWDNPIIYQFHDSSNELIQLNDNYISHGLINVKQYIREHGHKFKI